MTRECACVLTLCGAALQNQQTLAARISSAHVQCRQCGPVCRLAAGTGGATAHSTLPSGHILPRGPGRGGTLESALLLLCPHNCHLCRSAAPTCSKASTSAATCRTSRCCSSGAASRPGCCRPAYSADHLSCLSTAASRAARCCTSSCLHCWYSLQQPTAAHQFQTGFGGAMTTPLQSRPLLRWAQLNRQERGRWWCVAAVVM